MTAKQRKARWKLRQRKGIVMLPVPVRDKFGLVDRLIDIGWLTEAAALDDRSVGEAVARIIDEWRQNTGTRSTSKAGYPDIFNRESTQDAACSQSPITIRQQRK
jgi:hypothetical protein